MASADELSLFETLGADCEGLVVAVTLPVSSFPSRLMPKISAALQAAKSTDASTTIFTIEAGVITITRWSDLAQSALLASTLRRFYPPIKSCCA
jgi:hypothetical protein